MNTQHSYYNRVPQHLRDELSLMPKAMYRPPCKRRLRRELAKPHDKRSMKWKWFILLLQKSKPDSPTGRLAWHWMRMHTGIGSYCFEGKINFPLHIRAMAIDPNITEIE